MDSQVVYADRLRIRYPGRDSTLPLHLDSSSIERWEDEQYRDVYREIFEGRWEDWDPSLIDRRPSAKQDLYQGMSSNGSTCSVFRSFQGWLALSDAKPGEGTIWFLPDLKCVLAYILLRPFFDDGGNLDLSSAQFPGATPGSGQFMAYDRAMFPHLQHNKSVVGIPYVKPGDFVLWHADLLHEVDEEHKGDKESSVVYIAHTPLCPYNIETLKDSRECFDSGAKPRDFRYEYDDGPDESSYEDRGREEHLLSLEGKQALGLGRILRWSKDRRIFAALPLDYRDIDVLVNNAGKALGAENAGSIRDEDVEKMFATNVVGLIRAALAVLGPLRTALLDLTLGSAISPFLFVLPTRRDVAHQLIRTAQVVPITYGRVRSIHCQLMAKVLPPEAAERVLSFRNEVRFQNAVLAMTAGHSLPTHQNQYSTHSRDHIFDPNNYAHMWEYRTHWLAAIRRAVPADREGQWVAEPASDDEAAEATAAFDFAHGSRLWDSMWAAASSDADEGPAASQNNTTQPSSPAGRSTPHP
ncbi:hypothetical protein KL909_004239 [Ogataea angusta]|nr:hypothetical protein KL909_004239 [Ogataea angusta]